MATNPSSIPIPPGFVLDQDTGAPQPLIPRTPAPQTPAQSEHDKLENDKLRQDIAKTEKKQPAQIPPAAASGIQANIESLRAIDAAMGALNKRPESIGPGTGMLGDTFTQLHDPDGTDTRSRVGKLGAVTIHDLSGAAVSATEAPRFQPFVPTVTDTPEVATQKLKNFREALQSQIKESLDYYGPNNGYMPYKTPQADQFLQSLQQPAQEPRKGRFGDDFGAPGTEVQFKDDAETRTRAATFHDELYKAMSAKQFKTPADEDAWVAQFNTQNGTNFKLNWGDPQSRKAFDAASHGKEFGVQTPDDPAVQKEIQRRLDNRGGASDAAIVGAATDIPFINHIAAGADAVGRSFAGHGSFVDNYGASLDATRGYEGALRDKHFPSYLGGQIGGAALLPMGEARTPSSLARVGAAYGAAYGFDQGDPNASISQRTADTIIGGAAGGATGYAIPKGIDFIKGLRSKGATAVPDLVDAATGELNQPMDAMRPAERVKAMRGYGLDTITPGMAGGRSARVIEQGLNNVPGSAGVMEDVNSKAAGELRRSMQGVAQKFGTSKTLNEGGSELQRGANQYIERANTVAGNLYKRIPISDKAPASLTNTTAALSSLTDRFSSNPDLAEMLNSPTFAKYSDALQKHGLSWQDLKSLRSMVGDKIGEMRFGENDNTKDFRSLYGALSEDMRATANAQGPAALKAFERANDFYSQKETLIEGALSRILGPNAKGAPERAAAAVQAMTQGGKASGDLKTLAQIKSATVKSGAWNEIASTLIHLGGQPAKSEGRQFDPKVFVQWYADMAEPARAMLFKPEQRKALEGFVSMNQQLSRIKGLTNTSNTTPTMIGSGVVGASGVLAASNPLALLIPIGGGVANFAMAKLWTSPKFVRWATGYTRAVATGNTAAAQSRVGILSKLAATNPELREPIQALLAKIANDNVPAVGTATASPDERPDQQQ